MLSYHNDLSVKIKYVDRMKDHIAADELIRGTGFDYEQNKGCAVGCTLNNYQHSQYPIELGIPEWLARLEDSLFEGMSLEKSKTFPLEFLEAIEIGVDLEKVKVPFLIFILKSVLDTFDHDKFPDVLQSINTVIDLYEKEESDLSKFEDAAAAADAAYADAAAAADAAYAAYAAYAAAADAADAADAAAAAYAAAYAAAAAAYADAYAAAAYAAAADAAAAYAAAAYAAAAAAAAAAYADAAYDKFADKLLELLRECK
jgi:hypothetical protein